MTTQVFYRKWRPLSFQQLAGQEHVSATLRQSINLDRISHSYLFCGPRGSGKTTTARIIAKAVNCLDLREGDPCNECAVCLAVNDGRFMDIIEMDAASNRGIDEIRDIREKVNFAPVQGRRKVYIIDEAHMLTDQASNAFLKTLEEPPAHVMFILCTTEAHKILPTIVSRCQRFDFKRIPSSVIYQRLDEIAKAEGSAVSAEALRLVARHAEGSLRDAENLLEQLVVTSREEVTLEQVEELLGLGNSERWLELAGHLLIGNTNGGLDVVNQAAWNGTDVRQMHRQTVDLLRAAMLLKWGNTTMVELPDHVTSQLQGLVSQLPPWRIMKALKIWGEVNLRYDAPSTLPLELAVVEICDDQAVPPAAPRAATSQPQAAPKAADPPRVQPSPVPAAPAGGPPREPAMAPPPNGRAAFLDNGSGDNGSGDKGSGTRSTGERAARESASVGNVSGGKAPEAAAPSSAEISQGAAPAAGDFEGRWMAAVKELGRHKGKKYNLGALLRDCKSEGVSLEGDTLVLAFTHRTHLERMQEEMDDPVGKRTVGDMVSKHFGASYNFKLVLAGGDGNGGVNVKPSQSSPLVRTALGMGARILEETAE